LLYVQPVYVESTGETSYPLLQKILVAFGDQIAFEDTLDEALDVLFGGDSGADASDGDAGSGDGGTVAPDNGDSSAGGSTDNPALTTALEQARVALLAKQAALAAGDWSAFGEADQRLAKAIEDAIAALK
jgi:uncharacterized membrane protein (UPF0182 family)